MKNEKLVRVINAALDKLIDLRIAAKQARETETYRAAGQAYGELLKAWHRHCDQKEKREREAEAKR